MNEDKKFNELDTAGIKAGDVMAFHFYVKVESVGTSSDGSKQLNVINLENGQRFSVTGEPLIKKGFSGNWFGEEITLSRTKIIGILKDSLNRPIQIKFVKKDGSDRTMICRFLETNDTGYAQVEELDGDKLQLKQVDLRTMEWIIVDGTKYVVK
jgi:hypothetical protein